MALFGDARKAQGASPWSSFSGTVVGFALFAIGSAILRPAETFHQVPGGIIAGYPVSVRVQLQTRSFFYNSYGSGPFEIEVYQVGRMLNARMIHPINWNPRVPFQVRAATSGEQQVWRQLFGQEPRASLRSG